MSSVLTIRREDDAHVGFSFHIHVPDRFAAFLKSAAHREDIAQLVIGRDEIIAWALISHHPVLTCFGRAVNLSRQYLIHHPDVEISASIGALVTTTSANHFTATIQTGSMRVITRRPFVEIGSQSLQPNRLFSANTGNFFQWLRAIWQQEGKQVAGLVFGRNDEQADLGFEVDLIDSETKRRRVSLIELTENSQLWQLSSCGVTGEYLHPAQELERYQKRVTAALRKGGFRESVRLVERRSQNETDPGVFYRRRFSPQDSLVQTIIRPNFGLQFSGGGLRKTWFPATLKEGSAKLILHQQDEIGDEAKTGAPFDENSPDEAEPNAELLFVAANNQADLQPGSQFEVLRCNGIRSGHLQDGKLWQFGPVDFREENKPACMPGPLPVWTRWDLPDQPAGNSPEDNVLLPVPLQESLTGWQINLAIENNAPDQTVLPLLRLTLDDENDESENPKVTIELYQGQVSAFSPPLNAYARRLQDPTAPPNEKRLSESLRHTRLVFSRSATTAGDSINGKTPAVTLSAVSNGNTLDFRLASANDAIVGYVPHVRDAGIDYLSAGSKNLRQRVDTQTLRTVVERDTTHLLVPLGIKTCLIRPASPQQANAIQIAALSDVTWVDLDEESAPHLAASMALAPWVSMHDSLASDIADSRTRVRSLHHRNLALEHGEFAVASLDRGSDGIPRGLAENIQDFLNATRDDYTVAVESLPNSLANAAEIINWLPGADVTPAPQAYITYPTAADGLDRAPVIEDPVFTQNLKLRDGVAGGTHQDWLTADVRLTDVTPDGEGRPSPLIHAVPVKTDHKPPVQNGHRRARNGSVPLLFDGKNFAVVALDSSSQPLDRPLTWSVAAGPIGIVEIDRGTGAVQATLLEDAMGVVRLGTSRTSMLDWTSAVHEDGAVDGWVRQTGSSDWVRISIGDPAGMSVTSSAIASHADTVAILAIDQPLNILKLWVWQPQPDEQPQLVDVIESIDEITPSNIVDSSLLFGEDELFIATVNADESVTVCRGVTDDQGEWTFTALHVEGGDQTRRVALGYFDSEPKEWAIAAESWMPGTDYVAETPFSIWVPADEEPIVDSKGRIATPGLWNAVYPSDQVSGATFDRTEAEKMAFLKKIPSVMLGTVSSDGREWRLAERASEDAFRQVDVVTLHPSDIAADIRLVTRPDGKHGLPVGCRPGWVVIANESGSLDLWPSAMKPEQTLYSVDARLAATFPAEATRHPLVRLSGHPGGVLALDEAWISVNGSTGSRSGLLSSGEDGAVRLWNCETAQLVEELRADTCWMDNLGTLRGPHLQRRDAHSWTQLTNKPLKLPATRSEPSGYDPVRTSISFSTGAAPDEMKLETWLVRDAEDPSHLTEIGFSCESLRLRLRIDMEIDPQTGEELEVRRWIPEPVATRSDGDGMDHKLAPSRGYAGVFGFYSTVKGTNVPASDYLPRVAGLPMFIKDIESMTFTEAGEDPWKIMSMTVTAVLINPLLLDGEGATLDDIRHGDAPAFLTTAIQERSLVTVELKRNHQGQLVVHGVRSPRDPEAGDPQRITWNTLISDELPQSDSTGFRGRLEQLTFTVSYNAVARKVLLHVDPVQTEVQVLDGSQPLQADANSKLVLEGIGGIVDGETAKELRYRFESLLARLMGGPISLPMIVTNPGQRFGLDGDSVSHLATDDFAETSDFLTCHGIDGQTRHQVAWWDSKTGLVRSRFITAEPINALAYGRGLAVIGLFPEIWETGGAFDALTFSRREFFLEIEDPTRAESCELPDVRIPGSSSAISAVTTVTGQRKSVVVAGDESGILHLLDPATGVRFGAVKLASAAVEFLTGVEHSFQIVREHEKRLVVAAICEGSIWLADALTGELLEEFLFKTELPGSPPKSVSLLSAGDTLWVFAASDEAILRWKLRDGECEDYSEDPLTIESISAGIHDDSGVVFFTTSDGKLKIRDKEFAADPIVVAEDLPPHSCLDFFQPDEATHLIAIAAPGETLQVFSQTKDDDHWGPWTQTLTGQSQLPALTSRVQLSRAGDDVLAFTGPANQRVSADPGKSAVAVSAVVVSVLSGNSVAAVDRLLPDKSRWFFSATATWMPQCATSHGEGLQDRHVDLHSLVSNQHVRRLTLPSGEKLDALAFADNGTNVWLVAANTTQAHSFRLTGPLAEKTLAHAGGIKGLSASGPFAVVVGEQGIMFWEVGLGEESDNHRLLIAEDQAWSQGTVTFQAGQDRVTLVKVAATSEFDGATWELRFEDQWTGEIQHRFDVPRNVIALEYASVLGRDHLVLAGLNDHDELERVELWLPEHTAGTGASARWRFSVPPLLKPQVAICRSPQLGILVGGGVELSLWRPNQLICLTEQGEVRAQLDVDLELSADGVGFPVTAQLLTTGQMQFVQHNAERTTADLLLAGVTRLGLYCLIGDFIQADKDAGQTALVLYREPAPDDDDNDAAKVPLAGAVLQSQFIRSDVEVTFLANVTGNDGLTLQRTTELTQQTTRTFAPGASPHVEQLISGRIPLSDDNSLGSIHFADQRITADQAGPLPLMGMLLLPSEQSEVQGAVLCHLHPGNGFGQLHVEPGVYRVVPSTFDPAGDTIRSDYSYPTTTGELDHIDLCVPISKVTDSFPARYAELSGSPAGLQWRLVGEDRIPLNLCLDQARLPLSVSESSIPQLTHRIRLGRRLRFDQTPLRLFQGTSSTNWVPPGNGQVDVWQMQPLLVREEGLQLAEVGVIARAAPSPDEEFVTENVLAVVRPATDDQPAVVCLGTETGTSDSGKNLVSTENLVDAVNRRILLRQSINAALPPVYSLVPGQMLPVGGTLARQALGEQLTASAIDPRLLLHGAARRLILDVSLDREFVPSIADPELDLGLTALREIQVRQPTVRRTVNRLEGKDIRQRTILIQEATAFREMKRLWHQPDVLQPWIASTTSTADAGPLPTPFHPASIRLRLAPDKPGAMAHHRLQLALAEPAESSSEPVTLISGPQLSLALREPMQLNPPIGSSVTLVDANRRSRAGDEPWHRLSFSWKERLGIIPVRAEELANGEPKLEQVESQRNDGALPKDVEIELSEGSRNCLQLIVQINDQLVDLDRRQPLFPVYDARRAALTSLHINEQHDKLLPDDVNALSLDSEILDIDALGLVGQQFIAATTESKARVWIAKGDGSDPIITIDWADEGTVLRLGWWCRQPVALTNREGLQTRLFDPTQPDNSLRELTGEGNASIPAASLEITRLKSVDDGRLYDVAVALEVVSDTQSRLHVWSQLADDEDMNAAPGYTFVDEAHTARETPGTLNPIVTTGRDRLFLTLWSHQLETAVVHRLTIDQQGSPQFVKAGTTEIDSTTVNIGQSSSLATSLNGDESQPVLYCGRGDRTLDVIDHSGGTLISTELADIPSSLHVLTDSGRPLLAVTLTGNRNTVSILDGHTGQILRHFNDSQSAQGCGRLLPLGEPVLACSVDGDGQQPRQVQLYRIALAALRPGNLFLLTKADPAKLFEPSAITVKVKYEDGTDEDISVDLVAKLALLNAQGEESCSVDLEDCFPPIGLATLEGTTMFQFNPGTDGLTFSGAVAIRIEWIGELVHRDGKRIISAAWDRDRPFRLIPYSATAAKMSAVLSVDKPDEQGQHSQVMQRNLVFGDAADLSSGSGAFDTIENPNDNTIEVFAFDLHGSEQLDTLLPTAFDETWQLVLSLAKYHIDGQVTGDNLLVLTVAE